MKFKMLFTFLLLMFLVSCGTKKRVKRSKDVGVVLWEPKPKKLPSVEQDDHIKELLKSGKILNKSTLNYIRKYAAIAVNEMHQYKIPASITLAQGILESGNGNSELARKSNNHFGIKCHTNWKGERVYHDDDEKGECFRKYQYVSTSYHDHSEFLTQRKRYAFIFEYNIKNYKKWAKGLKKAGYATDKKYPDKLISLIETYKLFEYDKLKNTVNELSKVRLKPKKPTNNNKEYYKVEKGDTLYSISRKFNTTVLVLKEINGLLNDTLSIGQYLLTK